MMGEHSYATLEELWEGEELPGYEDTTLTCPVCVEKIADLEDRGFVHESDATTDDRLTYSQTPHVRVIPRYDSNEEAKQAFLDGEPYSGTIQIYCPTHEDRVSVTFEGMIHRSRE